MIRSVIIVLVTLFGFTAMAQQRTSSPYSYFGLGQQTFKGTIENRSMGSIRTYVDSIHVNLRNPAAYGQLRLTTYSVGMVHTENWSTDGVNNDTYDNTNVEYVSVGIPVSKKTAFGFGLVPFQSVGYNLGSLDSDLYTNFSGRGGLNRAYFSIGTQLVEGLSLGAEIRYSFGEEENSSSVVRSDVQYGTNERNETDFSGASWNFGAHYRKLFNNGKEVQISATYSPESNLGAVNNRTVTRIQLLPGPTERPIEIRELGESSDKLRLPSELSVGLGYGEQLKWFVGGEYILRGSIATTMRSQTPTNVSFKDATSYRLGGYYIPDYNSVTSYWKRVTYRAGLRYEDLGMELNGENITEFGISFGMSLRVGQTSAFSNATIGFEYGQRGSTNNGLVKEDFASISIGLSLNDRWFQKRKFK